MFPRNVAVGFASQEVAGWTHQKVRVCFVGVSLCAETLCKRGSQITLNSFHGPNIHIGWVLEN